MTGNRNPTFRSVRRAPRRRGLGALKVLLVALFAVVVLVGGVAGALWAEAWLRLGGEQLASTSEGDVEALGLEGARAPSSATTTLVALVEEHDPTAPRRAPLRAPVALVQATPGGEVSVVLLPEQLEVAVDGAGEVDLDAVHREHGLDGLVRGVVDYTGVAVDSAVAASVEALPRLADAIGGVERCGEGGCRILDGAAVRSAVAAGDGPERVATVVEVVHGLAGELEAGAALRSPLRARAVIDALAEEVVTDVSLRGTRVLRVADTLSDPRPVVVRGMPGVLNPDSGRLVVPPEQAATLFQLLQRGASLTEADEQQEDVGPVPEDVTLAVLNGTGTAGLAGRIESQLQGAGFVVAGTDNAPSFDVEQTVVAYGAEDPDAEIAAVLVADQLDGAQLEGRERPPSFGGEPVDVLVTVGSDLDEGQDG